MLKTDGSLALTIEGPSSVNYTKFTKGTITLKNVATAVVDNNTTGIVLDEGVVSFTSNSVVTLNATAATDLETLDITGVKNAAATPVATGSRGVDRGEEHHLDGAGPRPGGAARA